jgi:phage tail protein X
MVGPGVADLAVTTRSPLYEPIYELTLRVDCPGLPKVIRHYVLMLDLPGMALPPVNVATTSARPEQTPPSRGRIDAAPSPRRTSPLAPAREPVPVGTRYRVREGDTLSQIAARVEGRLPNTTWQLAEQIFAANPGAFINGNPDLIKLGYEITIPDAAVITSAQPSQESVAPSIPDLPTLPGAAEPAVAATETVPTEILPPQPAVMMKVPPVATAPAETAAPAESAVPTPDTVTLPEEPVEDLVAPPVSSSPFADVAESAPVASPPVEAETPRVELTPRDSSAVSPLLAVLLGLLLGLGMSIVLLRSKLLEGLSALFARGRAAPARKSADGNYTDTDEWLQTEEGLNVQSLALGSPAEQTYIVEVGEQGESTEEIDESVTERTGEFDVPFAPLDNQYQPATDSTAQADADAIDEQQPAPDTAATAEMSQPPETAETVEMPDAPMAEFGAGTESANPPEMLAPAAESQALAPDATGKTKEMPAVDLHLPAEPDMADLFADGLSDLPAEPDLPVEIFAGEDEDGDINQIVATDNPPLFDESETLMGQTAEVQMPSSGLDGLQDTSASEAMGLEGLAEEDEDAIDSHMSDTLQEAMSMLEHDFNDELTASQIIDQSELRDAIRESELEDELEGSGAQGPARKRAG